MVFHNFYLLIFEFKDIFFSQVTTFIEITFKGWRSFLIYFYEGIHLP